MKKFLSILALGAILTGCASRYTITLTNHNQITTLGKPWKEGGYYIFKDLSGQTNTVPAGRVVEIAPASMSKKQKEPFKPQSR